MRYFVAALLVATTGCGDSTAPADVIPEAVAGAWDAAPYCLPECGFTLVRLDNPADSVNFVSGLQQSFLFTITTTGRFDLTSPGGAGTIRGRAWAEGSAIIFRDQSGVQDTADYTLTGDYLGLMFRSVTTQFDFDGDNVGDPSTIRARFRRQ